MGKRSWVNVLTEHACCLRHTRKVLGALKTVMNKEQEEASEGTAFLLQSACVKLQDTDNNLSRAEEALIEGIGREAVREMEVREGRRGKNG